MLRNIAFTSSLLGLAVAAPKSYGSPSYPSGPVQQSPPAYQAPSSQGHSSNGIPTPSSNGTGPYQPAVTQIHHVTVTDHVTTTDHVTATDAGCAGGAAPSEGSAPSSAAGASGSYVANSAALSSAAASLALPSYTPAGPPTNVPAPPAATLLPATGPSHDAQNLTHLAPATSNNLYYSHNGSDTSVDHMFASLDMNFTKPAVVLENSAYVSNVTCSTDGIGITFNDDQGYNYAKQQWPSFGGDFILVSHSDGCKNTTATQRTFWQVSDAQFDDDNKACDVKCSEIGIDQAANDMHAEWGTWNQGGSDSSGSAAGSPSQTSEAPVTSITPPPSSAELQARGLWGDITSVWGDATSAVASVGESVVSEVTSKAESVVSVVTSKAVSAADKSFATSLTVDINASPTKTADNAPWPSAAEIVTVGGIGAYCVGCGAKGHADVSGSADISFLELKIKSGQFSVKGNMDATMGLGLDAPDGASFSPFNKKIELVQIPLSPLEIPEILVIGPYINLDADVNVDVKASGNIMMQVGASMPNFQATVDLLDKSKNTQSGFTPQWTKKFDAKGEITVTTTLGLPVELGFGLDVRALPSLNANVSVTNTASVTAYGNYSNVPGPCMDGVGWGIHFNDNVDLSVFGLYDDNLFSWQSPDVASGCIGGKNQTSSSTTSSATKAPSSGASIPLNTSGSPYQPTNGTANQTPKATPGTPAASGSASATPKQSGKPYSPTYSPSATDSPSSSSKVSSTRGESSTPSPIGAPYQPPKASSAKSFPSASAGTTLATSKSEDSSSKTSSDVDTKTSSSSSESKTRSLSTPTPKPTYNPPK